MMYCYSIKPSVVLLFGGRLHRHTDSWIPPTYVLKALGEVLRAGADLERGVA